MNNQNNEISGKSNGRMFSRDEFEFCVEMKEEYLKHYFKLTDDSNSLHYDSEVSSGTIFERPIMPGLVITGRIAGEVTKRFPLSVVTKTEIIFKKPLYMSEITKVKVIVLEKNDKWASLSIEVRNESNEKAVFMTLELFFDVFKKR